MHLQPTQRAPQHATRTPQRTRQHTPQRLVLPGFPPVRDDDRWSADGHPDAPRRKAIQSRAFARRVFESLPRSGDSRSIYMDAITGTGSGLELLEESPVETWGGIAVALYLYGMHPDRLRPVFRKAWVNADGALSYAAVSQGEDVRRMMRYCRFAIPGRLPETFSAWRGGAGRTFDELAAGWSWSLNRGFAAGFAVNSPRPGKPMLLRCTMHRADLVFALDCADTRLGHAEVIASRQYPAEVDEGSVEDWRAVNRIYRDGNAAAGAANDDAWLDEMMS